MRGGRIFYVLIIKECNIIVIDQRRERTEGITKEEKKKQNMK